MLIKGKMTQNRPTSWTSAQLSSAKLTAYSADKTCTLGTTENTKETRVWNKNIKQGIFGSRVRDLKRTSLVPYFDLYPDLESFHG